MGKVPAKLKKSKRPFLGSYALGWRSIDVYFNPESNGGRIRFFPDDKNVNTEVEIGINQSWPEVIDTILHEAMELVLIDGGHQYKKAGAFNNSSNHYWFQFNHLEYQEACARVGLFLANFLPEASRRYKKLTNCK